MISLSWYILQWNLLTFFAYMVMRTKVAHSTLSSNIDWFDFRALSCGSGVTLCSYQLFLWYHHLINVSFVLEFIFWYSNANSGLLCSGRASQAFQVSGYSINTWNNLMEFSHVMLIGSESVKYSLFAYKQKCIWFFGSLKCILD